MEALIFHIWESGLHWVYVSLGICCMAILAAFSSTIMEAAFGRLHNSGGRSAAPTVMESIMVDGEVNGWIKLMKPF